MFTNRDLQQLADKGISVEKVQEQLNDFSTGFPFLELKGAAEIGNGILRMEEDEAETYLTAWEEFLRKRKKIVKFVPASGAATRMFKDLYEFVGGVDALPQSGFMRKFFEQIRTFAFFADLDASCFNLYQLGVESLVAAGRHKDVIKALLNREGLNYGSLPKGLLKFHSYPNEARTPMEEHLSEAALYASGVDREAYIHFTVSPEHRSLFNALVEQKRGAYESIYKTQFHVSFSEQKPSTDTLAADENNNPFREEDGSLLFRPGGHGALIENLNDIDADVLFVKNIDNVVPDSFKEATVRYKKILGGVLATLQAQIDNYLIRLNSGRYSTDELVEMVKFLQHKLFTRNPETKLLEDCELAIYLKQKFNRPLRVCGVVKNEGEPGGGPFWAFNPDGTYSLQILESSQIDQNDPEKRAMMASATHFNPVDLVCSVRNYCGEKFDLTRYVDKNSGFISEKSKGGRALRALELPGLWNGAMSDWTTVFVEVPIETFNPVKSVNDLLRPEHLGNV